MTGAGRQSAYAVGVTGAELRRRAGGGPVAKLNSNENPLGPSPRAVAALQEAAARAHLYPPGTNHALTRAVAERHGLAPGRVVLTPGSVDLLDLLLRVLVRPEHDAALAFSPCFPALAHRARVQGLELRQVPVCEDYSLDLDLLAREAAPSVKLVYVANPDNPSGATVTARALAGLAGALPRATVLVVDEAYIEYVDEPEAASMAPRMGHIPNLAVVRTFSKAYGLAGLRVGYGLLPEWLAERVRGVQLSFAISGPAGAAALAALEDVEHLERSAAAVRRGRQELFKELLKLGCGPVPGQGGFVMFRPPLAAEKVFEALLDRGVAVRPLEYAGLPDHLRVSVGTAEENALFLEALRAVLARA